VKPGAPARALALERAYRATTYRAFVPGSSPIDLLVGQRSPALDRLLARAGAREWAFMTAWNPASRSLPRWNNAQRQRRLLCLLYGGAWLVLPGAGIPSGQDWLPEASFLVLAIPQGRAARLARMFGQHAIVAGRRGRPANLVWTA
jgi:hypothetical protein